MRRRIMYAAFWIFVCVLIDQLSKYYIALYLPQGQEYELLPFLAFYHTSNSGIAFSMLSSFSDYGLIILTLAIIIFMLGLLWRNGQRKLAYCGYLLVIGGAFGNLLDRIRLHYVVDFILFHIGSWSFAIFNIADAFITVGAALILLNEFIKPNSRA